jgi:hypothetical protein
LNTTFGDWRPRSEVLLWGGTPTLPKRRYEFSVALTDGAIRSGAFDKVVPTEKRKWNNNKNHSGSSRNNNTFKKPANAIRTFAATQPQALIQQQTRKVGYVGPNPKYDKYQPHHVGPCVPCQKCGCMGHFTKYCKFGQTSCYECGALDHFKSVCLKVARDPTANKGRGGPLS